MRPRRRSRVEPESQGASLIPDPTPDPVAPGQESVWAFPRPAIAEPTTALLIHGLPVGLSFIGTAYAEAALLRAGYAYEQASHARTPPRYLPTVTP